MGNDSESRETGNWIIGGLTDGDRTAYFSMRSNVTPGTSLALFCMQNLRKADGTCY